MDWFSQMCCGWWSLGPGPHPMFAGEELTELDHIDRFEENYDQDSHVSSTTASVTSAALSSKLSQESSILLQDIFEVCKKLEDQMQEPPFSDNDGLGESGQKEKACFEALQNILRLIPPRISCVLASSLLSVWRTGKTNFGTPRLVRHPTTDQVISSDAVESMLPSSSSGVSEGEQNAVGGGGSIGSGKVLVRSLEYLRTITQTLDSNQQEEMYQILFHLPSSVLGDRDMRESTRVFVNIRKDARTSQQDERQMVSHEAELVDTIQVMMLDLIAKFILPSHFCVMVQSCLHALEKQDQFRLILQEMIIRSKKIPADQTERKLVLQDLLPKVTGDLPTTKDKES